MTTAAAPLLPPPAIPDADLTPLLDVPDRRVCEMWTPDGRERCGHRADWRLTFTAGCHHKPQRAMRLACSDCAGILRVYGIAPCRLCGIPAELTRVEALR